MGTILVVAGWFVSPVIGKLINACSAYLDDQVKRQTGLKEELQKLRDIQPEIKAVIFSYSQGDTENQPLNDWYWQLRDAIDEADDVLDEIEYKKLEKQANKNKKTIKVRSLMKSLRKRFVQVNKRALKIDHNLKRLELAVKKLNEISSKASIFLRLLDVTRQKQEQEQFELLKTRETGSMPANGLIGRKKERKFVRNWLMEAHKRQITHTTDDSYGNISLLSVVGHPGMGKTFFLQHVCEDVRRMKEFSDPMWACVSNNFDAITVIKDLLESYDNRRTKSKKLDALHKSLKSVVKTSKKFLIVLDDIWEDDETKWKQVLTPLQYGGFGSKILITTRMRSVVSMFNKIIKNNRTLELKGLEKVNFLRLFNEHAFAFVKKPDDEYRCIAKKIGEKIFEEFSGCPLAAKAIGGILKTNVEKRFWTYVLENDIGNLKPGQNELLRVLKLSYIYLPHYLQNCFAFCGIFPRDHKFDKDDLIRMWIAVGFIQSSDNPEETLVDTGRWYFNILVHKSFFYEFSIKYNRVYYKMHNLLHKLAQLVSTKECFRVGDDKDFPIPQNIRHLSIDTSGALDAAFKEMKKLKKLRSLFVCYDKYDHKVMDIISEICKASKNIRLLVISTSWPQTITKTICSLIHLRYLKADFLVYWKPPRSISHLYHLKFMFYKSFEMNNIEWEKLMPNENCQLITDELVINDPSVLLMEQLRSISSLRWLTIKENDELVSFTSETEQWFLQHSSSLFHLEFEEFQSLQSLPSSLESLSSLKTLRGSNLVSLQCLPSSLSTISSLTDLKLINIPLLESLPNLPSSLKKLDLKELNLLKCLPSLSTISSLTHLKLINIPLLESLPDLPSSVINLDHQKFKSLPSSLSNISSLTHLELINIPLLKSLPDLPSSVINLYLEKLESLQFLPSSLSTISSLTYLKLKHIPILKSLPVLPSSLQDLDLEELESLQCLPSLSAISSLYSLYLSNIQLLKSLSDLSSSLKQLVIKELKSLQCLPDLPSSLQTLDLIELENLNCLPTFPTTLSSLWIVKVPRLLELPDLPASLENLKVIHCNRKLSTISSRSRVKLKNTPLLKSVPKELELEDLKSSSNEVEVITDKSILEKVSPAKAEMDFIGRDEIPIAMRQLIDACFQRFQNRDDILFSLENIDDIAFSSENIKNINFTWGGIEDLIINQYLSDYHIDAFALKLREKNRMSQGKYFPFLYISSVYWAYDKHGMRGESQMYINHISKASVLKAKLIIISIIDMQHCTLLVGFLEKKKWQFYDSLPNPTHRENLPNMIQLLYDDRSSAFQSNITSWPIEVVEGLPIQKNNFDCGMYVCKYMETIVKSMDVNWANFNDWESKMPIFRVELACALLDHA